MSKVLWHITMSLDGFIAPRDYSTEWMFEHGIAGPMGREVMERTGAILAGRRGYHLGTRAGSGPRAIYGGAWQGPVFVLTHRPGDSANGVTFRQYPGSRRHRPGGGRRQGRRGVRSRPCGPVHQRRARGRDLRPPGARAAGRRPPAVQHDRIRVRQAAQDALPRCGPDHRSGLRGPPLTCPAGILAVAASCLNHGDHAAFSA